MTYNDNAQSNFTVQLKSPIELPPNFKVGLASISYGQNILLKIQNVLKIEEDNKLPILIDLEIEEHTPFELFIDILNNKIVEEYYKTARINHNDIKQLKYLVPLISKSPGGLLFFFDIPKNTKITFHEKLAAIIGLPKEQLFYEKRSENFSSLLQSNPFINTIDHFLVYVDIIEDQYFGDVMAPIIRTVTPTGNTGDLISTDYESPHYVNLKKTSFSSININIRDSQGNLIQFNNLFGKVIVKLHFKKDE